MAKRSNVCHLRVARSVRRERVCSDRPENLRHSLACMAYICHVDPRSCAAVQSVPDAAGYIEPFTASSDPQISLFAFSVRLFV